MSLTNTSDSFSFPAADLSPACLLEMLWAKQQDFDLQAHLSDLFVLPPFDRLSIQPDDNPLFPFCFLRGDQRLSIWLQGTGPESAFVIPQSLEDDRIGAALIAGEDPQTETVYGYWVDLCECRLVFDLMLWEELGRPLDGRGFRLDTSVFKTLELNPFVLRKQHLTIAGSTRKEVPGLQFYRRQDCWKEPVVHDKQLTVQSTCVVPSIYWNVLEAVNRSVTHKSRRFDLLALKALLDEKKNTLQDKLTLICCIEDVSLYGYRVCSKLSSQSDLMICAHIPGQGLIFENGFNALRQPADILREWWRASKSSHSDLQEKATALSLFNAVIGTSLTDRDLNALPFCWMGPKILNPELGWASGRYCRLASFLIGKGRSPLSLDGPNAWLFQDDILSQWLPARADQGDQPVAGLISFFRGVLCELENLSIERTARLFCECFPGGDVAAIPWQAEAEQVALRDLMADGYFTSGKTTAVCAKYEVAGNHAALGKNPALVSWISTPSQAAYSFVMEEDVLVGDYIFHMAASEYEFASAWIYCQMPARTQAPIAADRIPGIIVYARRSPRIPVAFVEPLSARFAVSQEHLDSLPVPYEEWKQQFQQAISEYWDTFDQKYPYFY